MTLKTNQKGFTIIELLIATAVFSTVLLIVTYGIIQISRMYTNGFIQTQTQNDAVSLSNKITQDIEFSSSSKVTAEQSAQVTKNGSPTTYYYFCTTNSEYFYTALGSLYQIPLPNGGCSPPASIINDSNITNLLSTDNNVVILNHSQYYSQDMIVSPGNDDGLFTLNIAVLYGDKTNLEYNGNTKQYDCGATVLIGPFCSIYTLNTQAYAQD